MLNTILGSCGFMSVFILSHLFAFVKYVSKIFLIFLFVLINDGQNDLFGFLNPNVNNYHFFRKSLTRSQKVIIIISTVFIVGVLR